MLIGTAPTKDAALAIALPAARQLGYVYMILWQPNTNFPDPRWTVEDCKPFIRSSASEVIDVDQSGKQMLA